MKTILFHGLKRSGNHGILNLIEKSDENFVHVNDTVISHLKYKVFAKQKIQKREIDLYYTGFKDANLVILSVENNEIDFEELNKFNGTDVHKCLLLRNPYNLLSSVYKYYMSFKDISYLDEIIDKWIKHADIFIEQKEDLIYIIYDKFYENEKYRTDILEKLNIEYDKVKQYINDRPGYAYSSWDEDVSEIPNDRYLLYIDDKEMTERVFKNKEIFIRWKKICEMNNIPIPQELIDLKYIEL